jgi:rSAM/selenodomain-associated transferase 2
MAVEVETEKAKWLSVIVPVYQEPQDEMKSLLAWIEENSDSRVEWIIVGAIGDQSFESVVSEIRDFAGMSRIVSSRLKTRAEVNVIVAPRGRSKQMNAGANQASGQILLFLHADTRLAKGWIDSIEGAIREARSSWGAFSPGIAEEGVVYRIAERWGLWRSRGLGLPYGDQAMFIDIRLFWKLGGFDETVQFMEEVELARKLCRSGKWPIILPEVAATSGRRWRGHGIWQSARNIVAFLLYMAGIPRESIRRWYSG